MKTETFEKCKILTGTFAINFLMGGALRVSHLYFVEFITLYNISRKAASFPFVLCVVVRNIIGPLIGYLEQIFGMKTVTVFGCVLGSISMGACFFAENILTIIILWGVIHAIGTGLGCSLIPLFLNEFFPSKETGANGIASAGICVGAVLLPLLMKVCVDFYGVSGSFLILSAILFNSIPAALLLENRKTNVTAKNVSERWEKEAANIRYENEAIKSTLITVSSEHESDGEVIKKNFYVALPIVNIKSNRSLTGSESEENIDGNGKLLLSPSYVSEQNYSKDSCEANQCSGNSLLDKTAEDESVYSALITNSSNFMNEPTVECKLDSSTTYYIVNRDSCENSFTFPAENNHESKPYSQFHKLHNKIDLTENNQTVIKNSDGDNILKSVSSSPNSHPSVSASKIDICNDLENQNNIKQKEQKQSSIKNRFTLKNFSVFTELLFIDLMVINAIGTFFMMIFWTIILDHLKDRDAYKGYEIYHVAGLAIGDMIGRFGCGFIIDRHCCSVDNFTALCFLFAALSSIVYIHAFSDSLIAFAGILMSLAIGSLTVMQIVIIHEFIEKEKKAMAMSSRLILSAPMILAVSPMIGYFRGQMGSYNGVFYTFCGVCLFSACTMKCAPYLARRDKINTS